MPKQGSCCPITKLPDYPITQFLGNLGARGNLGNHFPLSMNTMYDDAHNSVGTLPRGCAVMMRL